MLNYLTILAVNLDELYNDTYHFFMICALIVLISPWIFVIVKYGFFRKLRIRFMINNQTEYKRLFFKKGEQIVLPEEPILQGKKFVGWYIDEELTEEYIQIPMPDYNIKLYAKFEEE